MGTAVIPEGIEKRIMCARFYERIKAFYENPENMRRFEEWQQKQNKSNALPQADASLKGGL
nr:MAG TPA: hypothetical protein [Caudoviricetes sp.]